MTDIRSKVLHWLARRDYTQQEIRQKLKAAGHDLLTINTLISELNAEGLIQEQRFIENYIHWRKAKGVGPLRIIAELKVRGIAEEMIADPLQITDNAWSVLATQVLRKFAKDKPLKNYKEKAKQHRFLQYRGFTSEQIKKATSAVASSKEAVVPRLDRGIHDFELNENETD